MSTILSYTFSSLFLCSPGAWSYADKVLLLVITDMSPKFVLSLACSACCQVIFCLSLLLFLEQLGEEGFFCHFCKSIVVIGVVFMVSILLRWHADTFLYDYYSTIACLIDWYRLLRLRELWLLLLVTKFSSKPPFKFSHAYCS